MLSIFVVQFQGGTDARVNSEWGIFVASVVVGIIGWLILRAIRDVETLEVRVAANEKAIRVVRENVRIIARDCDIDLTR